MTLCKFYGSEQVLVASIIELVSIEGFAVEVSKLDVQRDCDIKSLKFGV